MRNKYEQEVLRSQLEIQEQTLRTINKEIHDNIGQSLVLAKLQLYGLKENYKVDDIQPTRDLISKSISDLRDLSKSLNPGRIADIGLAESIRHELQLIQKTTLVEIVFEVKGIFRKLSPEKEIIAFRIFQEVMNNTIRHSKATHIKVCIQYVEDWNEISLSDNGKEFDANFTKGSGINNVQNRAKVIDADLDISNGLNGTTAVLRIPVAAHEANYSSLENDLIRNR